MYYGPNIIPLFLISIVQHVHVMINDSVLINLINHCYAISVHEGQLNSSNGKVYL